MDDKHKNSYLKLVIICLGLSIGMLFLLITIVNADTLKGGWPACQTKDLFDEWVTVDVAKDQRGRDHLMNNGCMITGAGLPVTVLEDRWGRAKVRVYVGDDSLVIWTYSENIVSEDS